MRSRLATVAVAVAGLGLAPAARAADAPTYTIDPHATDPAILDTPPPNGRGNHLVWLPPAGHAAGKLLVFLPTGGLTNIPSEFTELGTVARRLGYHTILLAYRNEAPIAAQPTANPPGCGPDAAPSTTSPNCARDARLEILDGGGESDVVNVDRANSIENRLDKLLVYLKTAHPGDGWQDFADDTGEPVWSKTVIAGSSLGAGEAVMIAERHDVDRAALLHGWVDAAHGWVKLGATPSGDFFTLIHARDNFFARTCTAYKALDLTAACPLAGFPTPIVPTNPRLIENRPAPYGTQIHVFDLEPGATDGSGDIYHQSTSRNHWIAKEADGVTPSHILVSAWRSVLGDSDADTYLDGLDNCAAIPNTDQLDSDHDGIGDPCDPVTTGGAGGSVPATLSLTLGGPAGFGPFAPGVDRDYDASSTAAVISTAGDGALAVSDPAAATAGRLVNGTFALAEPLQVKASSAGGSGGALAPLGTAPLPLLSYAGPVSNDAVTIAFRQHIGATQALRTGNYSKTLTFTLSTTTP